MEMETKELKSLLNKSKHVKNALVEWKKFEKRGSKPFLKVSGQLKCYQTQVRGLREFVFYAHPTHMYVDFYCKGLLDNVYAEDNQVLVEKPKDVDPKLAIKTCISWIKYYVDYIQSEQYVEQLC